MFISIEKKSVLSVFDFFFFFDHKSIYVSKAWITFPIQVSVQCNNFNCRVGIASVVSDSLNDVITIFVLNQCNAFFINKSRVIHFFSVHFLFLVALNKHKTKVWETVYQNLMINLLLFIHHHLP